MIFLALLGCHALWGLSAQRDLRTIYLLLHVLQFARQEAIYSANIVFVAPSSTPDTTRWPHTLTVFSHTHCIRSFALPKTISLFSNQITGFQFSATGHCLTPGTLTLVGEKTTYRIVINDGGRARVECLAMMD